jgi:hypothetical protein
VVQVDLETQGDADKPKDQCRQIFVQVVLQKGEVAPSALKFHALASLLVGAGADLGLVTQIDQIVVN